MFINKIDINTNTIKRNKNQLSFKAGKVDFYSDFDHTYFPSSQSGIRSAKPEDYPGLVKYFESFKRFFNNTREGLKFHLTSGRTFGEFETISYQTKESGFQMPLPDTFIAKNGSDEYVRVSSDDEFYRDGKFPFRYDATNKEKEEALRAETGWDGPKIKAKLREILKEHDFEIVENDTGNSVGDYGYRSFFDSMLKRDNFPLNSNTMPERSAPIAALRNDGNLKIYLSFPYDTLHVPERESVYHQVLGKMSAFFQENGIRVAGYSKDMDKECGSRPADITTPRMDESCKRYARDSKEEPYTLTKLYDTKKAIKRAIKNNDLVIVAGDSSNDYNMLNPAMYIDLPKSIKNRVLEAYVPSADFADELLHSSGLSLSPEDQKYIIRQLDDLPFVGIVVKNKDKGFALSDLADAYGPGTRFPKIIEVEEGHLEDGVRQAIKMYAEKNPEYAAKLSPDLRKEIFGIIDEQISEAADTISKKKFKGKYFALLGAAVALLGGVALYFRNKKKQKKEAR